MQLSTFYFAVTIPILITVLDYTRRLIQSKRERKGLSLPPGPTRIPLLGNAHAIDIGEPWKTYTQWHVKYGDVLYVQLLDQEAVILGSQQVAIELLEKRSQLYSDRPHVATITALGGDCNFAFARYGDHWRLCRQIFHQSFRSKAALSFRPMQLRRARQLVVNILNDPGRYACHYSTFATSIATSAAYGYEANSEHDPIVQVISDYTEAAVPLATPEQAILLKLCPFLLHVPDWFPGSSLKREVKRAYDLSLKVMDVPYQYTEEKTKSSQDDPTSMVSNHLIRMRGQDEEERVRYTYALKRVASSSVLGSAETTSSSLMTFTLAMILHPHIWKRAQTEIDAVVGTHRLPEFDDRSNLPYVEAILREVFRWHPAFPLGIWHATSSSDVYNGQYIPNGTMVVANAWAMSRDQVRFPNAEAFIPERFIGDDGSLNDNNPVDFIFGFGRRICPGRHTADASVWSAIATMLATLDFFPPIDAQGRELNFEPKWLNGITHRPDVFPCRLIPRAHVDKAYVEHVLSH